MMKKNKRAQEEIVGFVVIVVIISVALLILLGFLLRSSDKTSVESYEIESFIQSTLQYTSDCEDYMEYLSIQKLIIACEEGQTCLDGMDSCEVLDDILEDIIKSGWNVGEQSVIKGYKFKIMVGGQEKLLLEEGNKTVNYKGAFHDFTKKGTNYEVFFDVYYS